MNVKDSFQYILKYYDKEVVKMMVEKYGYTYLQALKLFFNSETYRMLREQSLEMWQFGCPAIFDMWECEQIIGDPRKSIYIREM